MATKINDKVGIVKPNGNVGFQIIRSSQNSNSIRDLLSESSPFQSHIHPYARQWRWNNYFKVHKEIAKLALMKSILKATKSQLMVAYGALYLKIIRTNGEVIYLGLAGTKVVTDNGVGFIVDGFQNLVELENMKYHGIGTGSTAESASETALVTELTTEYSPDNTRATGTTTENGSNVYRTVGTNTVDATVSLREHGIFTQAATGGGVLLDRTLYSLITLNSGDSLQSTYDLTITSGG